MNTLSQQLIALIAQHMGMDEAQIDPSQKLIEVGVASLEMIEIVMLVEDKLSIVIPDDMLGQIESVADFIEAANVASRMEAESPAL
jgi:acyl carrier protein